MVSGRVFDNGELVARVDQNKLWTNSRFRSRTSSDRSTFEVFDHLDDQVFRVRFLNSSSISVIGRFRAPNGRFVDISEDKICYRGGCAMANCSQDDGGGIVQLTRDKSEEEGSGVKFQIVRDEHNALEALQLEVMASNCPTWLLS